MTGAGALLDLCVPRPSWSRSCTREVVGGLMGVTPLDGLVFKQNSQQCTVQSRLLVKRSIDEAGHITKRRIKLLRWLEGSFHQGGAGKRPRRPSELSGDRARNHAFRAPHIYSDIEKWPGARKMRVLVCGGRDFGDVGLMISVLDRLHTEKSFTVLIHGNARGADRIADAWAWRTGVPRESYGLPQGEWDELGKKAGPLRNQRMLDEGKPDLVVAFPGSGGTKDMVRRAAKAGVAIHEVNRADDW
jgi:hypothetical protein